MNKVLLLTSILFFITIQAATAKTGMYQATVEIDEVKGTAQKEYKLGDRIPVNFIVASEPEDFGQTAPPGPKNNLNPELYSKQVDKTVITFPSNYFIRGFRQETGDEFETKIDSKFGTSRGYSDGGPLMHQDYDSESIMRSGKFLSSGDTPTGKISILPSEHQVFILFKVVGYYSSDNQRTITGDPLEYQDKRELQSVGTFHANIKRYGAHEQTGVSATGQPVRVVMGQPVFSYQLSGKVVSIRACASDKDCKIENDAMPSDIQEIAQLNAQKVTTKDNSSSPQQPNKPTGADPTTSAPTSEKDSSDSFGKILPLLLLGGMGFTAFKFSTRTKTPIGNVNPSAQITNPATSPHPNTPPARFSLRIQGQMIPLNVGTQLQLGVIPGLTAQTNGIIAYVSSNPKDPTILGLQNCSYQSWIVISSSGQETEIAPDRSLKLTIGAKVNFGSVTGDIC